MGLRPSLGWATDTRPEYRAVLKPVVYPNQIRRLKLVGGRVAEKTTLPTEGGPLIADGAMHLVSARLRRPVDGTIAVVVDVVKVVEASDGVRGTGLVCGRVAEILPTEGGPLIADGAMHLVSARLRRPVNGAELIMLESADAVRCGSLGSRRRPEEPGSQRVIFVADGTHGNLVADRLAKAISDYSKGCECVDRALRDCNLNCANGRSHKIQEHRLSRV